MKLALTCLVALAIFCALLVGRAQAQPLGEIFNRANTAYFAGDYREAARGYDVLREAGIDDADVSYNLGLAHARLGEHGHAIQHLEHTITLRPGDEEAEAALAAVRSQLGRARAEVQGEALVQTRPPFLESLVRGASESLLAWVVLLLNLAFFGVLVARHVARAETPRLALGIAVPIVAALLLLGAGALAVKVGVFSSGRPAVIVASAALREGPDARAGERGTAREGESARIVDTHDDWARIELSGGRAGWVAAGAVGAI